MDSESYLDLSALLQTNFLKYGNYKYIKCNYPVDYANIIKLTGVNFTEKLYKYINGDVEHKCVICGKPAKFINFTTGYARTCCLQCACKDPQRRLKIKQSTIDRYGVENVSQSDEIKRKKVETCLSHFGVESPYQAKEIRDKVKSTMLDRYGVENASQSDKIKRKKVETCLRHFGVENSLQAKEVRDRVRETLRERYGVTNIFQLDKYRNVGTRGYYKQFLLKNPIVLDIHKADDEITYTCSCTNPNCTMCSEKTFSINNIIYSNRKLRGVELCTIKHPVADHTKDTSIELMIRDILTEYHIEYVANDRSILGGKELDIYIPKYKLAIECNGIYWHSLKSSNYHYDKFRRCREQSITLLSLGEDLIISYPEKVKSLILSKLDIYDHRIYARQCTIKEIDSKQYTDFVNNYHLQNSVSSSVRLGLFYQDELVSVMSFGKGRKCLNSKDEWELRRYCCKSGYQVVGGASKLFKYFIEHYNPSKVVSFAANDISNGSLYRALGFREVSSSVGYWYIKNDIRYHRYSFTKYKLVESGADPNKTEFEIMSERGYYRIYDSGQTKYEFII